MGRHKRRSRLAMWVGTLLVGILPSDGGKRRTTDESAEVRADTEATVPIPMWTQNLAPGESGTPQLAVHGS